MKTIEPQVTTLQRLLYISGYKVDTMYVAVGNIYRCDVLDGWCWMYEPVFVRKASEFLNGGK